MLLELVHADRWPPFVWELLRARARVRALEEATLVAQLLGQSRSALADACERERERSKKCLRKKKKRDVACFRGIVFIVLHAYVVITCSYYWSLTTFHHLAFIISLPFNPQSPLDSIVPCIIMGGELRAITSLW